MRVTLVLTQDCNLRCDYCYAGEKIPKVMPDRVAWQALKLLFQNSRPGQPLGVGFFGGEPLLEFARMARYTRLAHRWARRQGREVLFQVTTNATILTPEILGFFQRYPFRVAFSVDGLGAEHDRHRPFVSGRPSSRVVWRNLERAAGRLRDASIQMVLSPDTLGAVLPAVRRLQQLGYRRVSFLPNLDTDWNESQRREASDLYSQARRLMESGPALRLRSLCQGSQPCGFGDRDLAVSPSGALYPCARLVGADLREGIQLGHVRNGPDPRRLERLQERARAKQTACGLGGGCQCQSFMPGNFLRQMDNARFFGQLGGGRR